MVTFNVILLSNNEAINYCIFSFATCFFLLGFVNPD